MMNKILMALINLKTFFFAQTKKKNNKRTNVFISCYLNENDLFFFLTQEFQFINQKPKCKRLLYDVFWLFHMKSTSLK
jgi:hypothetical protein